MEFNSWAKKWIELTSNISVGVGDVAERSYHLIIFILITIIIYELNCWEQSDYKK